MYPVHPQHRNTNIVLTGKVWTVDEQGFAVPADPPPLPEAAPVDRRK